MGLLQIALVFATFLCSIVTGFLFAFAVVVMAGIKNLNNREFIRAFQAIDGVIQNNQPIFVLVWIGSALALIVAAALGVGSLDVTGSWILIVSTLAYLVGVQLPTFAINIPLNNKLQSLKVDAMDESAQEAARKAFEGRWNRWNVSRTVISSVVSLLLVVLVLRV